MLIQQWGDIDNIIWTKNKILELRNIAIASYVYVYVFTCYKVECKSMCMFYVIISISSAVSFNQGRITLIVVTLITSSENIGINHKHVFKNNH